MAEQRHATATRLRATVAVGITALLVVVPPANLFAEVSLVMLFAINVLQPWSERLYG